MQRVSLPLEEGRLPYSFRLVKVGGPWPDEAGQEQ